MSTTGNETTSKPAKQKAKPQPKPANTSSKPSANTPDEPHISITDNGHWQLNLPPNPQTSYSIPTETIQNIVNNHNTNLDTIQQLQHTINTLIVTGNVLAQQLTHHPDNPINTTAIQAWNNIIK